MLLQLHFYEQDGLIVKQFMVC